MKRIIILCLLVSVLLTGCGISQGKDSEATGESAATPTTPQLSPLYTPNANGITVKTDYSDYDADSPHTSKYTRLSEELLTHFQPSDTYGAVYPFMGNHMSSIRKKGDFGRELLHYGLVTEDGCIVVDPIYSAAYPLMDGETNCCLPYWVLESIEDDVTSASLVSMDGSFILEDYAHFSAYGGRILCVENDSDRNSQFVLLDSDRTVVFSSQEHPFADKIYGDPKEISYEHDYFLVPLLSDATAESASPAYYFINLDGALCFGPYTSAAFMDGHFAKAFLPDGSDVYLDLQKQQIAQEYHFIRELGDGYVLASSDSKDNVINPAGNIILSFDAWGFHSLERAGDYFIYVDESEFTIYHNDGATVKTLQENVTPLELDSLVIVTDVEEIYIEDLQTGKTVNVPTENYMNASASEGSGMIQVFYHDVDTRQDAIRLYTKDLEYVAEIDAFMEIDAYQVGSPMKKYTIAATQEIYRTYDSKGKELPDVPVTFHDECVVYNDLFFVTDQTSTRIYNRNMELIFSYPLPAALQD